MGETEVCRERLTFSRILARNGRLETGRFDGVRRRQSQFRSLGGNAMAAVLGVMIRVRDGRQENVKVFIKKRVGIGSSSEDLADALLIIFKTNSSGDRLKS